MNFIGHAYVARLRRTDTAFVLGAMLPDFLGMARIRGATSNDPDITAGISFHHACDDAFHRGSTFVELCGHFGDVLEERGLRRGPARAVAHVGLELLMDGFLLDRPGVADDYLAAIAAATPDRLGQRLVFTRAEHSPRYRQLSERLTEWGLPSGYRQPLVVRDRLVRILRDRPRLALSSDEAAMVGTFLPEAREAVQDGLESMVAVVTTATRDLPIG